MDSAIERNSIKKGEIVCKLRITLDTRGDIGILFVLNRTHFPVRLAFVKQYSHKVSFIWNYHAVEVKQAH